MGPQPVPDPPVSLSWDLPTLCCPVVLCCSFSGPHLPDSQFKSLGLSCALFGILIRPSEIPVIASGYHMYNAMTNCTRRTAVSTCARPSASNELSSPKVEQSMFNSIRTVRLMVKRLRSILASQAAPVLRFRGQTANPPQHLDVDTPQLSLDPLSPRLLRRGLDPLPAQK
jgi:hypothetical protein